MNKKSSIIIAIIVLLVVAAGAFYGGMFYDKSQNTRLSFAAGNLSGARNARGPGLGNFVLGNIISKDSNSITLQIPNNGGSKIIFYSDKTQIGRLVLGTADDLAAGASVSVTGTTNSDGSVTASSIQIRPSR